MSKNAHEQSEYKLAEFSKCKRCKVSLVYVSVIYENSKNLVYEWECPKCAKVYNNLPAVNFSNEDKELHYWCKDEQSRRSVKRNRNYFTK